MQSLLSCGQSAEELSAQIGQVNTGAKSMWAEWLLYGLAGLIGLLVLIGGPMSAGWISPRTAITLTVCFFVFPGIAVLSRMQAIDRAAHYATTTAFDVPSLRTDQLFAGSNSCRACHAAEYDSWHASFHRTMTQVASPESVVAPFDGRTLSVPARK